MICNFDGLPQNFLNTPEASSVFPRNLIKGLLDYAGEMSVVLIFNFCNSYEIAAYDWLYSQY